MHVSLIRIGVILLLLTTCLTVSVSDKKFFFFLKKSFKKTYTGIGTTVSDYLAAVRVWYELNGNVMCMVSNGRTELVNQVLSLILTVRFRTQDS